MDFNSLLDELYSYTELENDGIELTKEQNERYQEICDILTENEIEIDFGVSI